MHPENSKPMHLLWDLYFLKVYPRDGTGCSAVSGSKGALDPKTMQKWVWLFLECIAEMVDDVVSYLFIVTLPAVVLTNCIVRHSHQNHRSCSRAILNTMLAAIV